jgi:hypothetical protein
LFGEQLDNPDARFELTLVLRARQGSPPREPSTALGDEKPLREPLGT